MARKASQSVKDRLAAYKTKPVRRSFFDDLGKDAKQFLLEVRDLYRKGELDLQWRELQRACQDEFPNEAWPLNAQTITLWVKGQ